MGRWEKRGFLDLENHTCSLYLGCLCLDSTLEKRRGITYYGGLLLIRFVQQYLCRECGKNKALLSPHPFLFQCRVQILNTFPSTVGHSIFPVLIGNSHAFNSIVSFVVLPRLLCFNIIPLSRLELLPRQKHYLISISHFLKGLSQCWTYNRSLNTC